MMEKTQRGFEKFSFVDRYGVQCSLTKSSLATEDCIWLGVDNPNPQIMASDAIKMGIAPEGTKPEGWIPFNVPSEVLISTHMHLTQDQVKDLLPILIQFAETGELE